MLEIVEDQIAELKKLWKNKRLLLHQGLNLAMIVFSALMIWKGLMFLTKSESPVVVVLSGSMEPAFQRGDILFLNNQANPIRVGEVHIIKIKDLQHSVWKSKLRTRRAIESRAGGLTHWLIFQRRDIPIVHRVMKVHEKAPARSSSPRATTTESTIEGLRTGSAMVGTRRRTGPSGGHARATSGWSPSSSTTTRRSSRARQHYGSFVLTNKEEVAAVNSTPQEERAASMIPTTPTRPRTAAGSRATRKPPARGPYHSKARRRRRHVVVRHGVDPSEQLRQRQPSIIRQQLPSQFLADVRQRI